VVIDGHCWIPTNQLFKNIVDCFEKSGADCLARPQLLDAPDISNFQKAVALARASRIGHGGDSLIYSDYEGYVSPVSHGAIYKREVFEKICYVDESFDACEDVEFNYRVEKAGLKTYMSPKLTVKYYPRESLWGLLKQMARYGRGRFQLLKKHPKSFSFSLLVPIAFVLGMLILPMLGVVNKFFLVVFISLYCTYILILLTASFLISFKNGLKYFYYLLSIFFVIHFGLGIGFLSNISILICG
jgi:GT2 family glycosyltransferase